MENVIDNEKMSRFEWCKDNCLATIDYTVSADGKVLRLTHAFVPYQGRGHGIGHALVKEVLEEIKATNRKVVPVCPFISAYIRENPEWKVLVTSNG